MFLKVYSKLQSHSLINHCKRLYSQKQFQVTPFCHINFDANLNLNIRPLDVFQYQNYDQVIIKGSEDALHCVQDEDQITITGKSSNIQGNCSIIAPVKANFTLKNVCNVNLANFNGEYIKINAKENVHIDKCQAENISILTMHGNILSKNALQAAKIKLEALNGNIKTGKLQGLNLHVSTRNGNITTNSTYCDHSIFETITGDIILNNTHKNVKISIKEKGNLNIVGFDGVLSANINEGNIEAQFSRILEDSSITIAKNSNVILKLADECQEQITFEIQCKNCILEDNINMNLSKIDDKFYVSSKQNVDNSKKFLLNCKHSLVNISTANWSEMFSFATNKKQI